jgi:PIN domain nuclease of toxin-antitoxin system
MPGLVLDTHAAVWYLQRDSRLSKAAEDAIDRAIQAGDPAYVASISVVELTYLVEKGRVPAAALEILRKSLTDPSSGFSVLPLDLAVADALAKIPREDVPDLPDRVIAATALSLNLPLVTRDGKIREAELDTIW